MMVLATGQTRAIERAASMPPPGMLDIQEDDVRQLLPGDADGIVCGAAFADHIQDGGAAQSVDDAFPKQRMVVDDRYAKALAHPVYPRWHCVRASRSAS